MAILTFSVLIDSFHTTPQNQSIFHFLATKRGNDFTLFPGGFFITFFCCQGGRDGSFLAQNVAQLIPLNAFDSFHFHWYIMIYVPFYSPWHLKRKMKAKSKAYIPTNTWIDMMMIIMTMMMLMMMLKMMMSNIWSPASAQRPISV